MAITQKGRPPLPPFIPVHMIRTDWDIIWQGGKVGVFPATIGSPFIKSAELELLCKGTGLLKRTGIHTGLADDIIGTEKITPTKPPLIRIDLIGKSGDVYR